MQNSTNSLKSFRWSRDRALNGVWGPEISTVSNSWLKIVSNVGPLIKGDFFRPNPWSYTVVNQSYLRGVVDRISIQPGNRTELHYWGQLKGSPSFGAMPGLQALRDANYNRAVSRLNEKVRGSLDLATSLAETGQLVKMLNLVGRLKAGFVDMAKSYNREVERRLIKRRSENRAAKGKASLERDLKRWQSGLARRHPKSFRPVPLNPGLVSRASSLGANGWCEFTYGWNPLISDIRGVAENMVGFVTNHDKVSASSKLQLNEVEKYTINSDGCDMPGEIVTKGFVRTKFGVWLAPGWDTGLARWTSLNPASVAWELIPYSFVVDWLFDIGEYLRGLETAFLYGNIFQFGYQSELVWYERKFTSIGARRISGLETQSWSSNASYQTAVFSRRNLISYPAPRIPSFNVNLGSNQLISAASLLRQLLGRGRVGHTWSQG